MFSVLKKLRETCLNSIREITTSPLLNASDLQQLHQLADTTPTQLFNNQKEQAQPLLGEAVSVYYGQGLEFEENRLYTQGDDPRFINWRLLARTGDLYSKIFRESRRPQLFVVMDRRSRMHFATRRQLKVTLAARVAAFMIYQSLAKEYAVSGVVIDAEMQWYDSALSEARAEDLLQAINAPSEPGAFTDDANSLESILRHVQLQLKAGNVVLLISDFHDLDATCESQLLNLTRLHDVIAVCINDPAELYLPTATTLTIANEGNEDIVELSSHDTATRSEYMHLHNNMQKQLQARLEQAGCQFIQLRTDEDLEPLLSGVASE
jgi:uncharacterized protein (DUF58 family)